MNCKLLYCIRTLVGSMANDVCWWVEVRCVVLCRDPSHVLVDLIPGVYPVYGL